MPIFFLFIQKVLVKGKRKVRAHPIASLKKLVRGAARGSPRTIALQAMANAAVKKQIFKVIKQAIQKEIAILCRKSSESLLRKTSLEVLCNFSWERVSEEIGSTCPTFHAVLDACVDVRRQRQRIPILKPRRCSNEVVVGVCAAIILRHRNHHMNLLQRLISLILHNGHSSKQVCIIVICLS